MGISTKVSYVILLGFVSILMYINFQIKDLEWDMPGYLGAVYKMDYPKDKEKVLKLSYQDIEKQTSPEYFKKRVLRDEAYYEFSQNAEAFDQQIPYFQIKTLYVFFIFIFIKLGINPVLSVFLPNYIGFFLSSILIFSMLKGIFKNNFCALSLSMFMMAFPAFQYLLTISTPDALGAFFLIYFLFAVIRAYPLLLQLLIIMLLVLTRADFVVFGLSYFFAVFCYSFYKSKTINFQVLFCLIIVFLTYFAMVKAFDYPGWKSIFYDSMIHRRVYIHGDEKADFTFKQYLELLSYALYKFKKITVFVICSGSTMYFFAKTKWQKLMAVVIIANIYLKLMFFPKPAEIRFYLGYLIILLIWVLYSCYGKIIPWIAKKKSARSTRQLS